MNKDDLAALNAEWPLLNFEGSKPVYIYGLCDPRTNECRYIGKSERPAERLTNHMNEKSNCHRSHWLQSLRRQGLKPEMVIFERIEGEGWPWQCSERFWIAYGRAQGWPLTNNTEGGDGVSGLPIETRQRIAATWIGRKHRPESIEKLRAASTGRKDRPETLERKRAAALGRVITWGEKISAATRKLSADDVESIGRRLAAGELNKTLAAEYGVHRTTLSKIKTGKYCVK